MVNTNCTDLKGWCATEHWITIVSLYIGSVFYALLISNVGFVVSHMNRGESV